MDLSLTDAERELLVLVLEERQTHFLHEIAKAHHHHEFKHGLKKRCELLESVLGKLKAMPVGVTQGVNRY
jgi:hypothetical protein